MSPGTLLAGATRPTLLVFVHPLCPCTHATLVELQRLVARCSDRIHTRILFHADTALALDWSGNDLWRQAHEVPGAEVELDPDGRTAKSLGVHTSGQALLYAEDGRLLFAGGITASRGHQGENAGEDQIVGLLEGRCSASGGTPVFGCPLARAQDDSKSDPR